MDAAGSVERTVFNDRPEGTGADVKISPKAFSDILIKGLQRCRVWQHSSAEAIEAIGTKPSRPS